MARYHLRAAAWHGQNGLILEAIHHASLASDDELVERLIEQHYLEMMNRGEMSWVRSWMGSLSKELVYRRPWLCLYEASDHSWFGELEEANRLLDEAEKRIRAEARRPTPRPCWGITPTSKAALPPCKGIRAAPSSCALPHANYVPADNLEYQIDFSITLGYEYFLSGRFRQCPQDLERDDSIRLCRQGDQQSRGRLLPFGEVAGRPGPAAPGGDFLHKAARLMHEAGGHYRGAAGLVEIETAALLCEWNDVDAALVRVKGGLENLHWWGKADDFFLAFVTLARIEFARGNQAEAAGAIEEAARLVQTVRRFLRSSQAVEAAQVRMWLAQGDWPAVDRWAAALDKRFRRARSISLRR